MSMESNPIVNAEASTSQFETYTNQDVQIWNGLPASNNYRALVIENKTLYLVIEKLKEKLAIATEALEALAQPHGLEHGVEFDFILDVMNDDIEIAKTALEELKK